MGEELRVGREADKTVFSMTYITMSKAVNLRGNSGKRHTFEHDACNPFLFFRGTSSAIIDALKSFGLELYVCAMSMHSF